MASNSNFFWNIVPSQLPALVGDSNLTYGQLLSLSDKIWEGKRRGVVAIMCTKHCSIIAAYLGALRNGIVPLLLDEGMKTEARDRLLLAYCPEYIVGSSGQSFGNYNHLESYEGVSLFEAKEQRYTNDLHEDLAVLVPTSGSTGDPKCVRWSYSSLNSCTNAICDYLDINHARRTVSLLPFHYSYGLSVVNITLASQASMFLTQKSVVERELWEEIEAQHVTDISAVPFMFEIMRRLKFSEALLGNLKYVTQAGGALNPKFTRYFRDYFAKKEIAYFTMYGQTEACPRISYLKPEDAVRKEGSIGQAISCGKFLIAETGESAGTGELLYQGENVALGYSSKRSDLTSGDEFCGELLTGDMVEIDDEGFAFFLGRKKRFVKIHGVSVNLDHVELIVRQANIDCRVIGKDNFILFLLALDDKEALDGVIASNFNFHKSIFAVKTVDDLPLSSSGKPDYGYLGEMYLG